LCGRPRRCSRNLSKRLTRANLPAPRPAAPSALAVSPRSLTGHPRRGRARRAARLPVDARAVARLRRRFRDCRPRLVARLAAPRRAASRVTNEWVRPSPGVFEPSGSENTNVLPSFLCEIRRRRRRRRRRQWRQLRRGSAAVCPLRALDDDKIYCIVHSEACYYTPLTRNISLLSDALGGRGRAGARATWAGQACLQSSAARRRARPHRTSPFFPSFLSAGPRPTRSRR